MRALSPKVQEVYIGSGATAVAAQPRETAARVNALLTVDNVDTFYGKSHILNDVTFDAARERDRRAARPQRRRQVDAAEDR